MTLLMLGLASLPVQAYQTEEDSDQAETTTKERAEKMLETAKEKVGKAAEEAKEKVAKAAEAVDQSEEAKKVSAGLLDAIYQVAQYMSFPAFHWLAFALMVGGTVGFALQLVLGKLIVLVRGGFSITEILSDGLGFLVSLIGLVLTTQAAAQNSTFTQSAALVLSSAIVGILIGIVLYVWGQMQELQATRGRSAD